MAAGPFAPRSQVPVPGDLVFPWVHIGAGSSGVKYIEGLGVKASLSGADGHWYLIYELPMTIPAGTPKLRLEAVAAAVTGNAKVNPTWAIVAAGTDFSSATLTAEGVTTVAWGAGDSDDLKETKITLDAASWVAADGKWLIMDLVFDDSAWTLAAISTWIPSLIFE